MKTCFMFPGQGTQKAGMLRELGKEIDAVGEVFEIAAEATGRDVRSLCLTAGDAELKQTQNTQLAVTAMNIAYYTLLTRDGARPDIVMGHSLGQFSALYAAGVFSLFDLFRIVDKRARLMSQTQQSGALCTVLGLGLPQVQEICTEVDPTGQRLSVALHNTEQQVVVGGLPEEIERAEPLFRDRGAIRTIPVRVSNAFHTPLMHEMERGFSDFIHSVPMHEPSCRVILNCKGDYAEGVEDIVRDMTLQCCHTVHWYDGLRRLLETPDLLLIECGIGKVLAGMMRNTDAKQTVYSASNPKQRMQALQLMQKEAEA